MPSTERFDPEVSELTAQVRRLTTQAYALSRGIEMTLEQLEAFARELETVNSDLRRRWDDNLPEETETESDPDAH